MEPVDPKETAFQLINEFGNITHTAEDKDGLYSLTLKDCGDFNKQCALLCIQKIYDVLPDRHETWEYWTNVETEIKNYKL